MLAAALLVMVHAVASFDATAEATRKQYAVPLTRGRVRQIQLRLLGGMVMGSYRLDRGDSQGFQEHQH
jgi:hypothetical protein